MNAQMLLQSFAGGDDEKTYIEDVFSTYLYTGNGSTQTINNGIDLAGKGGLVWIKDRTYSWDNSLFDTIRGRQWGMSTNKQWGNNFDKGGAAYAASENMISFNGDGFTVGTRYSSISLNDNQNSDQYASWTFRRAPKFFDIVTYTGDGVAGRQIPHELGIAPGMITSKSTSAPGDWSVYHRSATGDLVLNTAAAQTGSRTLITAASDSTFTVSGAANTNGITYVAYLWAHDPSPNGLIQCGSFTTDTSGNAAVSLGWESQFLQIKASSTNGDWIMLDSLRGMAVGGADARLCANTTGAEASANTIDPIATGFNATSLSASTTYIYLAIRRPNKPPKTGAEVYKTVLSNPTNAGMPVTGAGFPPDLNIALLRGRSSISQLMFDRLRGGLNYLSTSATSAEGSVTGDSFLQDGFYYASASGENIANTFFRRAPGFFDVICDTGTGSAHAINHSLTVAPELIIRKSRSAATQWGWWHSALAATEKLVLNTTAGKATDATAFGTLPTATQFYVGASANTNASAATYVTYLFATCPGVSKVGYYTGNGTSLTVECGFSTGARFILAKSIDDAGDSFIWDSARGIVAANDPHLSLNTTAAEVTTDDSVDPYAGGFIINQNTATNINVNGKRYVFLAIA